MAGVTIVLQEAVLIGVLSLTKTDSPWPISLVHDVNVDDSVGKCIGNGVHIFVLVVDVVVIGVGVRVVQGFVVGVLY